MGLTHDSKRCIRREEAMSAEGVSSISLPRLVAAALIRYPRYLDPILGKRCEVEDVVAILAQQQVEPKPWRRLYLVGFLCGSVLLYAHFVRIWQMNFVLFVLCPHS